jgi:hypothetical protein
VKTARTDVNLEPELLAQVECARGDVPRQKWVTRAIEEKLQAQGYDITLASEPAEMVPIRPGVKVQGTKAKSATVAKMHKQPPRPASTWRSYRR